MRGSFRIVGSDGQQVGHSTTQRPWLILFAMAAVFGLIGVVFHFVAGAVAGDAALLAAEGKSAQATVIDQRIAETRDRDSDGDTRITITYFLTLTFKPAGDSAEVETEVSVPKDRFNALGEGDAVEIFYAPSRPTLIEFTRGETASNAGILSLISYLMGAVGLGLAILGVGLWRRARPSQEPAI